MFQVLEDNQVTLSTMKASRFVKAFEQEVSVKFLLCARCLYKIYLDFTGKDCEGLTLFQTKFSFNFALKALS